MSKINSNLIQEDLNNLHSIITNEIDSKVEDVYSASEVRTNKKWIDGKTIYRKVIQENSPSSLNTDTNIATIGSFDSLVSISMYIDLGVYGIAPLPQYFDSNNYSEYYIANKTTGKIYMKITNNAYTSKPITIIIEYTKATD